MMADMHRARHLAWELPAFGWDVEILAPDRAYQFPNSVEPDSEEFFCPATPVHFAAAPGPLQRALVRSGSIGWRALLPLDRIASRLLAERRFDLAYLSTTQFSLFLLGPVWRARFGLPYVLDIQDPIYRPGAPNAHLAGSAAKKWLNQRLLRLVESGSVRMACGIVTVSSRYLEALRARYGDDLGSGMRTECQRVIPFSGSARDFARRDSSPASPGRAGRRIVYVGVGGAVMAPAMRALCRAMRRAIERNVPGSAELQVELYGTMFHWREGERRDLSEIAAQAGLGERIFEQPLRVTYRRSLELLSGADGALVLGVDDEGYTPSKLCTYALSGKPVLAVMRKASEGADALARDPALGLLMTFAAGGVEDPSGEASNDAVLAEYLRRVMGRVHGHPPAELERLSAPMEAAAHAELFDACLRARGGAA